MARTADHAAASAAVTLAQSDDPPSTAEIAAELNRSDRWVRGVLARAGVSRPTGRPPARPEDSPPTHHTARGRALLARLVADATAAGLEPEAYLDDLRRSPGADRLRRRVEAAARVDSHQEQDR